MNPTEFAQQSNWKEEQLSRFRDSENGVLYFFAPPVISKPPYKLNESYIHLQNPRIKSRICHDTPGEGRHGVGEGMREVEAP